MAKGKVPASGQVPGNSSDQSPQALPVHPSTLINADTPAPEPGIPVASPANSGKPLVNDGQVSNEDMQAYITSMVAKMVATQALVDKPVEGVKEVVEANTKAIGTPEFEAAVTAEVNKRMQELRNVGPAALSGLDCTPVKDSKGRKLLMYVNRNAFPIMIPHPNDPGSSVTFMPNPDKTKPLGVLDFKTNPFYANFVGYKRSLSQETIPAYTGVTERDIEGSGKSSIRDLMRLTPEEVLAYIQEVGQTNPDIASQMTRALSAVGGRVSQAPAGA